MGEQSHPMQFNAALCFLFLSLSFLLIQRALYSTILAAIPLVVSTLVILSYLGLPTGFMDSLLVQSHLNDGAIYPGRMAPNTAVAFVVLACALLISGIPKLRNRLMIAALLAACSAVFGFVAAAGYVFDFEFAYGWGEWEKMAIQTSIAMGILGTCVGFFLWRQAVIRSGVAPAWYALLAFLVSMTFSGLAYQSSVDREIDSQHILTKKAGRHFQDVISSRIASRGQSLFRIAARWTSWPQMTESFWTEDVAQHVQDFPDLDAVGRTDDKGQIISILARLGSNYSSANDIDIVSKAIREKRFFTENKRGFTLTESFVIGEKVSFAIMTPLLKESNIKGAVFGVFDVTDFFNFTLDDEEVLGEYNFEIRDDERLLYQRDANDPGAVQKVRVVFPIFFGSQHWRLEVFPKQAFIAGKRNQLAAYLIVGGLSVSSLFALLIYLVQLFLLQKGNAVKASKQLQAILDGSTRVSIITTDPDGLVTSFNVGAEKMLGYTHGEITGKSATQFHLKEELELNRQEIFDETNKTMTEFEALTFEARRGEFVERNWMYVKKDGGLVPVNLIVTAIRDETGITGFVEIGVDVTSTERRLRLYAKRLERSNQELEEFSYVASHDLKEPVRNLISYSKLLEEDLGDQLNQDAKDDLGYIVDAARRMSTLVDDLLNLSRAGRSALKKEPFKLEKAIEEAQDNLKLLIEEKGATVHISNELPPVIGDQGQFVQLFSNLIGNALKFVEKGVIPKVEIGCQEGDKEWVIQVRDNGIGMKSEYSEQIFQPFKRLHGMTKYQGTGIGLAICRKIIERHDGRIWVKSKPGMGSSFYLGLPKQ
jgi:PAS domain S-box-containing protein